MALLNSLTNGLYSGEVVLLFMGIVLFSVLIFAFIYQILNQRSVTALLGFFVLPIVMIGYPSIKSFEYKDGVLSVDKTTDQLLANPSDAQSRQALEQQVQQIASRPPDSATDSLTLAKAQYALGHEETAAQNLEKALQAKADLPEALLLKKKMEVAQNLQRLAAQLEHNPADQQSRMELQSNIGQATQLKWANPLAITALARAQSAVGDHAHALETINKAVAIDPQAAPAQKLRETILLKAPPH